MLEHIELLHALGFDFISYDRGLKGPQGKDGLGWQLKPKKTLAELRAAWNAPGNCNFGIRLGGWSKIGERFLVGLDIDIDTAAGAVEAHAWLAAHEPVYLLKPSAISGSGGYRRHLYGTLSKVPTKTRTNLASGDGWSIDMRGNAEGKGCQNVWPGSLHPSGGIYEFEREFDVAAISNALELEEIIGGHFPTGLEFTKDFEGLVFDKMGETNKRERVESDDPDDLLGEVLEGPLDNFDFDDARNLLSAFDKKWWEDYFNWRDVGMCLKHQFGDDPAAFNLWCEFSKRSEKFDERETRKRWRGFSTDNGGKTMRQIKGAAKQVRILRELEELGGGTTEDCDEDLIGSVPNDEDLISGMMLREGDQDLIGLTPAEKKPDLVFTTEWLGLLEKGKGGVPKSGLHNTRLAFRHDKRIMGIVGYNEFSNTPRLIRTPAKLARKSSKGEDKVMQLTGPAWVHCDAINGDPWTDYHDDNIRAILSAPARTTGSEGEETFVYGAGQGGFGMTVAERDYRSALNMAAHDHKFHPVRDYLNARAWDGLPRAATMFIDYFGCPDTPYYREVCAKMLVAAVTRIFEPGHKFDFVVILEGTQGKRKSTFIEILAKGWFAHLKTDFKDINKMIESMQEAWVLEIPELSGFYHTDVRKIKEFISTTVDKGRLAWQRNVGVYPRQCIFIGSSNDKEYLRDDTGGRRFWPVECAIEGEIDTDRLMTEIDQIWAEAVVLYRAMRAKQPKGTLPLYLQDTDSKVYALEAQELRRVETEEDGWLGAIEEWLATPVKGDGVDEEGENGHLREKFCAMQAWLECLGFTRKDFAAQSNSQRLGRVLRRVKGFTKLANKHRFEGYGLLTVYHREQKKED